MKIIPNRFQLSDIRIRMIIWIAISSTTCTQELSSNIFEVWRKILSCQEYCTLVTYHQIIGRPLFVVKTSTSSVIVGPTRRTHVFRKVGPTSRSYHVVMVCTIHTVSYHRSTLVEKYHTLYLRWQSMITVRGDAKWTRRNLYWDGFKKNRSTVLRCEYLIIFESILYDVWCLLRSRQHFVVTRDKNREESRIRSIKNTRPARKETTRMPRASITCFMQLECVLHRRKHSPNLSESRHNL